MITKKVIKKGIVYLPLIVTLLYAGSCAVNQRIVAAEFTAADGYRWNGKSAMYKVKVTDTQHGDIADFNIQVVSPDNQVAFNEMFQIDFDMYGGGIVKAMQADDDPELEIVAWRRGRLKESFFLDFQGDGVLKKPFSQASAEAQKLVLEWHDAFIIRPATGIYVTFVMFACYFFVGLFIFFKKVFFKILGTIRSACNNPSPK